MFEILENRINYIENNKILGFVSFSKEDNIYNINYVYVDNSLRGKGIGKELVLKAYNEMIKRNSKYIITCSYAKKMLEKYNE